MISRTALARSNAFAARRVAARRLPHARFQSTAPTPPTGSSSTHLAAGAAGGAVVALLGYGYYYTSGLKTAVQTSKEVKQYLQETKDSVVAKAKDATQNTSATLKYLRGVAKSYSTFVPGAAGYVDTTFDELDALGQEHGDDMDKILKETKDQMLKAAKDGGADTKTAVKVYGILSEGIQKLQKLGKEAGKNFLEKNPKLKEKFGGGYEQLKSLAGKAGPEGKKTLDEVTNKLKEILSKGKIDDDTLKSVQDLIQDKTSSLEKLAGGSAVGGALASSGKKLTELFENVPDAQEALEKTPHLSDLWSIASDRSDDAKKLAKETFSDIMEVLEEKGKKAKSIAEKTKKDAEKSSDKK